ncbi:MAG: DUF1697 domain-containing protein [Chloroflexota bacterium]|nr:MAG: DUF1697 domain-containing protein [Chloroflexota bacterium]
MTFRYTATFVAFLRGINVGGHKPIKMEDLRKAFETMGFQNVRTLLASGNVVFDAHGADAGALVERIKDELVRIFGHAIGVIVRTREEIRDLVDSDPFEGVVVTPSTRLYVTFLSEEPEGSSKAPYESPAGGFKIVRISAGEVCSVLTLSPGRGTTELMRVLEKEFGSKVTTRNWNTVTRILKC